MEPQVCPTTALLTDLLAAQSDGRTLILTSGGRLARRLRHAFRLKQREKGRKGWLPPKIQSLNAWLQETWSRSWPEETPASPITLWRFWEKAVAASEPPEGLIPDLPLFQVLDETYRVRIRDKLPPQTSGYPSPLIAWREGLFQAFERTLSQEGLLHPVKLPQKILEERILGSLKLPEKVFLLGFEFPAPLEADLLAVLRRRFGAVFCTTAPVGDPKIKAVSLPDREEEVIWLAEEVLRASAEFPLHRIGLVVPNPDPYIPLLTSAFRELIGPSVQEDGGFYNISLGAPLWDQPLVQAGVLPLRFFLEGEPRALLLSLLLSPYYRMGRGKSFSLARTDRIWRRLGVDSGLEKLLGSVSPWPGHTDPSLDLAEGPLRSALQALDPSPKGVDQWTEAVRRCWDRLGYPVLLLPGEEGVFQHLQTLLDRLRLDLRDEVMEGSRFFTWLKTLLLQTLVNEPGYEQAGIQVLGLIEARGLSFDRLFLAGLSEGSLPQPVRLFPLLTPEERRSVQGATLESQFAFARTAFAHLLTASPFLTLTRPEEEKGEPLPPSPLWPDQAVREERNIWISPGEVWLRAEWLRQARTGVRNHPVPYPSEETKPVAAADMLPTPPHLSVTALETYLACPFRFFCERILQIEPLEEMEAGIPAREKGECVHQVLAAVTRVLRARAIPLEDVEAVHSVVRTCVGQVFKEKGEDPYWQVEKRRLLGEGEALGGLLGGWLDKERERWEEGWRWVREEAPFEGLRFQGWPFAVQGRIDRVDWNEKTGEVCCWDYKTGSIPRFGDICEDLLYPQLPLYLLALQSLPDFIPPWAKDIRAGFVTLKSEGELSFKEPGRKTVDWETCTARWVEEIARVGEKMEKGHFAPNPRPEPGGKDQGACAYCDYKNLCVWWKRAQG